MTKLNCTARNCVNNEGGLCGAEYIMIEGEDSTKSPETYCSDFKEDNILNEIKSVANTDFIGELLQIFSSDARVIMSPKVICHATKCFYNGNGVCEAKDIAITTPKGTPSRESETQCETFIQG